MKFNTTIEKFTYDARNWIRKKGLPAFKSVGPLGNEVSMRWWPSDDGYTTVWLCACPLRDEAEDGKTVIMVGEFDDGPSATADTRFHVDQIDIPGGNSWGIDSMLGSGLRIRTKNGEWSDNPVCNLSQLLNAFLWISKENVEKNGINSSGVLAGRVVPQMFGEDCGWDNVNGPCPGRRWYYQPWGCWRRGQTMQEWSSPSWMKPIPLFGQLVDPELVSSYTDVDVDMDGNHVKV